MITVIFSSFNGEKTVGQTLESFCHLVAPFGGWSLISVNNGSTDRTLECMQSYSEKLPIKILNVNTRGKNYALNEALQFIKGELVIFTDDDVIVEKNWLCALQECAQRHTEYELFGGQISPKWPFEPEQWILNDIPLGMIYAVTSLQQSEGPIANDLIWGPNMAVRSRIFKNGVKFQTNLGPDGSKNYMMGSETELTRRLAIMGVKAWFCRDAQVNHIIRENQMTKQWVAERFFRHGRATYQFESNSRMEKKMFWGVERWLIRRFITVLLKLSIFKLFGKKDLAFKERLNLQHVKGHIFQCKQQYKL